MNQAEAKLRVQALKEQLQLYAKHYYELNESLISDYEYDKLYYELIDLEHEFPKLITTDSPTQLVGAKLDVRFEKVRHQFPMLSLGNAFNESDLARFHDHIAKIFPLDSSQINYFVEAKIDGLSISLIYENGRLIKALTRGNGIEGENVTHNVYAIANIPKQINYQARLEVRGEIFLGKHQFQNLLKGGLNLANPRNAASGTLRQLDASIVEARGLAAYLYAIPNPLDHHLSTYEAMLDFLKGLGFALAKEHFPAHDLNEVTKLIQMFETLKDELDYEVDGVVIKYNHINQWADIGFTVKAPKFMIAYKFPSTQASSELIRIFPTVGRTGRITYNAQIKPVSLGGSTIEFATLHNASYIYEININVGDIVTLKKAGEIIPKILGVAIKHNLTPWVEALNCPSCQSTLVRQPGEVDQYCQVLDCPAKILAMFEHFVSRDALNIDALSTKTLELFLKHHLITTFSSLYDLKTKVDQLAKLEGFKDKSIHNLLKAIERSKQVELGNFLFGLGIRHLGAKNAKVLASRFGSLEAIAKASFEDLTQIRDFGPKVATSVVAYFQDPSQRAEIDALLSKGIMLSGGAQPASQALAGLTFVITGTLSQSRSYFENLITSHGANVASVVSKNTNFLLAGKDGGTKLAKAESLNVKIIDEAALSRLIGDQNGN